MSVSNELTILQQNESLIGIVHLPLPPLSLSPSYNPRLHMIIESEDHSVEQIMELHLYY